MHQDETIQIFSKIYRQIGPKWDKFIQNLKQVSDQDDESQLYYSDFVRVLAKYGVKMSSS